MHMLTCRGGVIAAPFTKSSFFSEYTQSFEALNPRAVAVVVDPIQSVKGKVLVVYGVLCFVVCPRTCC